MESEYCPSDPHRNSWFCRLGRWGWGGGSRSRMRKKEEGREEDWADISESPLQSTGPGSRKPCRPSRCSPSPEWQAAAFVRRPFNISVACTTLFDEEKSNIVWTAYGVYTDGMLQSSTWYSSYSTHHISSSIFSASYSVFHSVVGSQRISCENWTTLALSLWSNNFNMSRQS